MFMSLTQKWTTNLSSHGHTASVSSSCSSTFPVRIVNKYILCCDGEFQLVSETLSHSSVLLRLCGTAYTRVLWTVRAFLQVQCCDFPTDSSRNWIPSEMLCASCSHTVKQGRHVSCSEKLLHHHMQRWENQGRIWQNVWNVNTDFKLHSSIVYIV